MPMSVSSCFLSFSKRFEESAVNLRNLLKRSFPDLCLGCDSVISTNAQMKCREAREELRLEKLAALTLQDALEKVKIILKDTMSACFCRHCSAEMNLRLWPESFIPWREDFLASVNYFPAIVPWNYSGPIPSVVRRLKFARAWELGEIIGEFLALYLLALRALISCGCQLYFSDRRELEWKCSSWQSPGWHPYILDRRRESLFEPDYILPLPLHNERLAERGYNQAACIAESMTDFLQENGEKVLFRKNLLLRLKNTQRQSEQEDKFARFNNIKEAFYCPDETVLQGKNIILLDDVLTTGSTVDEAVRTLLQAGAACVWPIIFSSNRCVEKSPLSFCSSSDM